MTLEVWVTGNDGQRRPMWAYGPSSRPKFTSQWRNEGGSGPRQATWTLEASTDVSPAGLTNGARVEILDAGLVVWTGVLAEPDRGRPWQLAAFGDLTYGPRFSARGELIPDDAVDDAIARGWGVINPGISIVALPAAEGAEIPFPTVVDVLDAYAERETKVWGVGLDRRLYVRAPDTTPKWVYTPADAVMGTADENYCTNVEVFFVSADDGGTPPTATAWSRAYVGAGETITTAQAEAAAQRWGRADLFVNVTDRGVMTTVEAELIGTAVLNLYGARLAWTEQFEVDTLNLVDAATGGPAHPCRVQAGDVVRIAAVLDVAGNARAGGATDVLIADYEYDDQTQAGTASPEGFRDRSIPGAVEAAWTAIERERQYAAARMARL